VKGVGEKTAGLLASRGLVSVGDLLRYYPVSYDFYEDPVLSSSAEPGKVVSLVLTILRSGSTFHRNGHSVTYFTAADAGGQVRLVYFNMPYLAKTMKAGMTRVFRAILKQAGNGNLFLEQPASFAPQDYDALRGTMQPRYSLTKGLKNGQVKKTVHRILELLGILPADPEGQPASPLYAEYLPAGDLGELGLLNEPDAIAGIHFPDTAARLNAAHERLAFDEFLMFLLSMEQVGKTSAQIRNPHPMIETAAPERLIEALPYELTDSQKKAYREICDDLCGPYVMNRLLQGDVGSGKTILAFLALLLTVSNGMQGAMMAPTEVLAEQHMRNLKDMVERYSLPIRPVLLTGAVTGKARKAALEEISSGEANVVIGTHALIQDSVVYHGLGLVVTDEQHRFGVLQRERFSGKGECVPVLVMSATPIPRTLAIILYGDLSVSLLTDMPKNRLPIRNTVLDAASWREKSWRFIAGQIRQGRQAYIVCPEVENESGIYGDDMANVTDYTLMVRKAFPKEVTVASLHGRMKAAEKERIMTDFADHRTDLLVTTTVIEVGINVANATVMMIENAERFGLAQLHQLRGRVGRGAEQSYCIFLYSGEEGKKPQRLEILEHSDDGFFIAEQDLKLRGPGELLGVRQSGELGFALADIYRDRELLQKASAYLQKLKREDPDLALPEHAEMAARLRAETSKSVDFRSI
jgi:ATP-dependent DNA helicase RecG